MRDANPRTLLLVLVAVVPIVVALAFVVAIGLQRAGFGLVVWAVLPFVVSMALIGVLGVVLGRAATRRASGGRSREDDGV
jgi:nitrogen fixation/metabolism regulation signal transduction histidine kinase